MHKKWLILILLAASIAVHFAYFGHPNQVVFDEVHFGKFASAYYTHQYYFDIHPPLGKLLIAGFGKLFNFHPEYSFANIGQAFPDKAYMALRFLPTLAGTILPLIIFLLAMELGLAPLTAFFAGMLTTLDNALLAQSRYMLLDMFLLSSGFSALLFYFRYKNGKSIRNLLWMGLLAGLSASIKWTGIAFLGLAGIVEFITMCDFVFTKTHIVIARTVLVKVARLVLYFLIIPFVVYFSVFLIHFSLLTKSGDGDAFMTPEFRATLHGSADSQNTAIRPLNVWQKFIELNKEMYTANKTLTATHPYSSKWYTWPLMLRSIYYWNAPDNTSQPTSITHPPKEQKIYLIGNPLVWWGSTAAVILLLLQSFQFSISSFQRRKVPLILLGGYLINFLPFIGIGRVMFLYHYLAGLIFAILMFAYVLDNPVRSKTSETSADHALQAGRTSNGTRYAVWVILAAAALLFIFFAPLSYGLPLDAHAFSLRVWLPSWQ